MDFKKLILMEHLEATENEIDNILDWCDDDLLKKNYIELKELNPMQKVTFDMLIISILQDSSTKLIKPINYRLEENGYDKMNVEIGVYKNNGIFHVEVSTSDERIKEGLFIGDLETLLFEDFSGVHIKEIEVFYTLKEQ